MYKNKRIIPESDDNAARHAAELTFMSQQLSITDSGSLSSSPIGLRTLFNIVDLLNLL